MRRVEFHPEAIAEFRSAALYYEAQAEEVGADFVAAVERATQRISEYPEIGAPLEYGLRRTLVRGFPYGLLYRIEPERLYIICAMHLHRRPGYWQTRL